MKKKLISACFIGMIALGYSSAAQAETTTDIPAPPERGLYLDDVFTNAVGNGVKYNGDRNILQMSSDKSQTGAIWSKEKIDIRKKFTLESYVYMGNQGEAAADGMTFTLQNYSNSFLGKPGQYLGMYGTDQHYYASLELDSYYNGDGVDNPNKNSGLTQKGQHIGITTGGTNYHYAKQELPKSYTMSNNNWKKLTVTNVPMTSTYSKLSYVYKDMGTGDSFSNETLIYFDGHGDSNGSHNFLNSPYAYWGFTSATGAQYEINALSFGKIPQQASIQTKDIKIYKGQDWKPQDSLVQATDEEGNSIDLSDARLSYKDNVDTQKTGKYTVKFTYKGKYQQKSAEASITVLDRLSLKGNDITINQGDKFDPFDKKIELSAYDQVDGDLTNKIKVIKNDVDSSIAAAYHVTYQVENSNNEIAEKTINVTVKPHNPWPNGDTNGWKMFSGEKISLINDPKNSILDTNEVFYANKQASIYKIYSQKNALKEGKTYRVTVFYKPLTENVSLDNYRVKVSLKADPSSSDYRELINTTLNNGTPYLKGYYAVTNTFIVGENETNPLINVENFQGGYIGSVSVLEIQ